MPMQAQKGVCEKGVETTGVYPSLHKREFNLIREFILKSCGIKVADTKRLLLQNRLGKRIRALGIASYKEYYAYLTTQEGIEKELDNFRSAITTNETHFFREPHHFDILRKAILPEIVSRTKLSLKQAVRVWSAGCSSGQEVFTLAIVLDDWLKEHKNWCYWVTGSDIDSQMLEFAQKGRYSICLKKEVPTKYLYKYFEIDGSELVVKRSIKSRVLFRHQNLSELAPARPKYDVIFCRNVFIYLHQRTRVRLIRILHDSLTLGGYLVLGSSESLQGVPQLFRNRRFGKRLVYQRVREEECLDEF